MMRSKLYKFSFLFIACVLGFSWGYFSPCDFTQSKAEFSSEAPSQDPVSFATLPCPTEEQYQAMAKQVHLIIPEGPLTCDQSYRAILGKALLYMSKLKMSAPKNWLPDVQKDFADNLEYVGKNVVSIENDLTQKSSIAYNNTVEKKIYIGGYFFGMDPLSAISTIIHESRHSVQTAQKHVLCRGGDIPRSDGGCDQSFDVSATSAGAYAYEVLWNAGMALYGVNLSQAEREYLSTWALVYLVGRFNEIPAALAKKEDVLAVLDHNHDIIIIAPETGVSKKLSLKYSYPHEYATRIEFAFRNSGIMIYTNLGHLYSWSTFAGLQFYNDSLIPRDMFVMDAARVGMPGQANRTYFSVQTSEKTYLAAKLLDGATTLKLVKFVPDHDQQTAPDFSRYFLAQFGDVVFLTTTGELYLMSQDTVPLSFYKKPDGLQDPQGWVHGTGGVVYEDLYLLNKSGELKTASSQFEEIDDYHSVTTYTLKNKDFPIQGRGSKYFQGLKYEALMNDAGTIFYRTYGNADSKQISIPGAVDFTILHAPTVSSKVMPK
ncbi:hypothetical protein [Bdellovibrio sp. NC01]|uniref:hypothetical protein n=1 Tax=Bdellovibrio sp. NC01 TaxID=2220073 RepID=UPI00115992AA|nr:hypothetical protein [Bdellovibrio sp. NC01]QDK36710.1 hypothetical protein DOE51_03380 [Bdellovibrio sp. NC01]